MSPLAPTTSCQYDHRRLDFFVGGGRGFVVLPDESARRAGCPWVWYAPTFVDGQVPLPSSLHDYYMKPLLAAGFAVTGVDVGESWGSPAGRAGYTVFHEYVTREFRLARKACLFAQSRGGLMLYNWAAEHPDLVRCVGAIYPVCTIMASRVDVIAAAYGLSPEELVRREAEHMPLECLAPLAAERIPVLHLHGDADTMVPLEEHSRPFIRRYRELGGPAELIVISGKGHAEIKEYFEHPALREFFLTQGESLSRN